MINSVIDTDIVMISGKINRVMSKNILDTLYKIKKLFAYQELRVLIVFISCLLYVLFIHFSHFLLFEHFCFVHFKLFFNFFCVFFYFSLHCYKIYHGDI